jgi:basic amino acid/polyamine antiporter, APA family
MMHSPTSKEPLKREIGLGGFTLAIINNVVGTGIFALPAIIAANLGSAAIVAYLVCGFIIFLIALCFAEVGSKITKSGGTYTYIETAFGPFAGFIANNLFWLGACVTSDAAIANALADTLKYFFPLLNEPAYRTLFFALVFGLLAFVNIKSVRYGIRLVSYITFVKLLPLIAVVLAGISYASLHNIEWHSFPSIQNIGTTSLLLFYAFIGIETPVTNSGEIKNPQRNLPAGIIIGITVVLILYMGIQLVTQGVLGEMVVSQKDSPLSAVAGIVFGKVGITLMIIATAFSMLGALSGEILCIPRILYAGARDGILPKMLGKVHPRFSTPYISIGIYSLLGFLFSVLGGFQQLAIISSAATLLIYLGVVLATIRLRNLKMASRQKHFKLPGGIIIPLSAMLVILWLLSGLSNKEFVGIAIFIAILAIIYFFARNQMNKQTD